MKSGDRVITPFGAATVLRKDIDRDTALEWIEVEFDIPVTQPGLHGSMVTQKTSEFREVDLIHEKP